MHRALGLAFPLFFIASLPTLGCSSNEDTLSSTAATTSAGGTGGVGGTATAGTGGSGGATSGSGGSGGVGGEFVPTPDDIQFQAMNAVPQGEQLLYNDWAGQPNAVYSLTLDGATRVEVFRAFRVWSMGVSHAADRIAFACGDPMQEVHYGLSTGDAIQHTWMYDVMAQTASLVANGNINDECHAFSANDARLYVCRRYDFASDNSNKGYRVGRIDLSTVAFEFLTPDVANEFDLNPQPKADETELFFEAISLQPPSPKREIRVMPLPGGTAATLRADASSPVLSPEGTRYTFSNYADGRALYVADLAGTTTTKIVDHEVNGVAWSPDGQRVAFLDYDDAKNCAHIAITKADGSELGNPQRVRDCGVTSEFITQLAWIVR